MTVRLYLDDPYRRQCEAQVLESTGGWCALSHTVFYPGGGGQPADQGRLIVDGAAITVSGVRDEGARVWHDIGCDLATGIGVQAAIDWPFRYALMRHHGLMHVVNTVAHRDFSGIITGVQIGPARSRIDFKLAGFARERIADFEASVNAAIERALPVASSIIDEAEYRARPELIRTLDVLPPIVDGKVRIVTIAGFDDQACGGTHVHSTGEIGQARVVKFDNKGKDNKRFYWELAPR